MTSVVCDICFEGFSEADRVPKVLGCGHTLCSVCLNNLLESQKTCPTCKTAITMSLGEYATNFMVLKLAEITKQKSKYHSSQAANTLKNLEKIFLLRKEMVLKSVRERTSLKNLTNDITRLRQMLDMDEDILSATDAENLISELETDVEKIDEVLYCCGKLDLKPTSSLAAYMDTSCYLYELANRLHRGEDIYAYEVVQNSKPKYGKITLSKDRLDIQALTLSKVNKGVALVSFQELRKCITKENFRTFIEIGSQKMSFSITDSSYLALRFIKLCTGETGPTFKGVSGTMAAQVHQNYRSTPQQNIVQQEYIRIKKFMQNDVETEGFDDYDLDVFVDGNKITCLVGEVVVQMLPNGSCEIHKGSDAGSSYENVVAKMEETCIAQLYGTNPAVIRGSGISLIFKLK